LNARAHPILLAGVVRASARAILLPAQSSCLRDPLARAILLGAVIVMATRAMALGLRVAVRFQTPALKRCG